GTGTNREEVGFILYCNEQNRRPLYADQIADCHGRTCGICHPFAGSRVLDRPRHDDAPLLDCRAAAYDENDDGRRSGHSLYHAHGSRGANEARESLREWRHGRGPRCTGAARPGGRTPAARPGPATARALASPKTTKAKEAPDDRGFFCDA